MNKDTIIQMILRKKKIIAFLLFLNINNLSISQTMELFINIKDSNGNINYIKPYLHYLNDSLKDSFSIQFKQEYASYIHKRINNNLNKKIKIKDSSVTFKKATKKILNDARFKKVVMFNEEHHNPHHRLYLETLLKKFKIQGFNTLALETLSYKDSELEKRKYPISITGAYSVEPYFANLIRKALEIGYKVLPYETRFFKGSTIKSREINQSNNLAKIIKEETGKVLVLAGYSHISEVPIESHSRDSIKWMATLLKENYNIDPLTIDQTEILENKTLKKISIPYRKNNPLMLSKYRGRYDINLIYPFDIIYLHKKLGKKKMTVSFDDHFLKEHQLIQFYVKNEYDIHKDKAIPYEQFLIEESSMDIYLDPSKLYRLIVRDFNYNTIYTQDINDLKNIFIK